MPSEDLSGRYPLTALSKTNILTVSRLTPSNSMTFAVAVEFHGFLKRIHISGFHANRNLLSCNCVLGWSLEVISQEDIAVRLEACLPL